MEWLIDEGQPGAHPHYRHIETVDHLGDPRRREHHVEEDDRKGGAAELRRRLPRRACGNSSRKRRAIATVYTPVCLLLEASSVKRFLPDNGLSLAAFGLFLFSLIGRVTAGFFEHAADQGAHGQPGDGLLQ